MNTRHTARRPRRGMTQQVGISSALEAAVDFYEWAPSLRTELTHERIQERYECSRATAYRWLAAYRAVSERRAARATL